MQTTFKSHVKIICRCLSLQMVMPPAMPVTPSRVALTRLGRRLIVASIALYILASFAWTAQARTQTSGQAAGVYLGGLANAPTRGHVAYPAQRLRYTARNYVKPHSAPRGFTDLVGDRKPLSPDPGLATESASWAPASPWLNAHNMSGLFSACTPGSAECDAVVPPETTAAVQAALWASQNPPDCSKARYMVLEKGWIWGFGSVVHVHAGMLKLAIR